ncbi:hypothetical protein [Rhizobium sp. Rhizsp42]|uniref:hypothetical protein n=1 Tax=Rhizobium sp. Rhizsp42 TaxID=3243034 RepID=UPI0039AEC063
MTERKIPLRISNAGMQDDAHIITVETEDQTPFMEFAKRWHVEARRVSPAILSLFFPAHDRELLARFELEFPTTPK